jgi:uncharacterized protein
MLIGSILGFLIGIALGMLGGGGSILTVPVFVYVLHFEPKQAIGMGLFVVGLTSLAGAANYYRRRHVDFRIAFLFGGSAMLATWVASHLASYLSGAIQLFLFAVVMLVAATLMFVRTGRRLPPPDHHAIPLNRRRVILFAMKGLAVGTLTGLVGVGGGFLIVPALVLIGNLPMKRAVGTSLLIIAMNAGIGFLGYYGKIEIAWNFMLLITAVAIGGMILGTRLARHVPAPVLRRAFSVFLVCMACFILYQSRAVILEVIDDPQTLLR